MQQTVQPVAAAFDSLAYVQLLCHTWLLAMASIHPSMPWSPTG